MQKNINGKKKIAPVVITIIVVLYMVSVVLFALSVLGIIGFQEGIAITLPFLLIYVLIGLAVIIGILTAMRERLREIDGGEEDEAKKY